MIRLRQLMLAVAGITLTIALLVGVGWVFWRGVAEAPEVVAAVVAAAATLSAAIYARHIDRRRSYEQARLAQMAPMYEDLVRTFLEAGGLGSGKPRQPDLAKTFSKLTEKLVVWGSEAVVLQWLTWREASLASEPKRAPTPAERIQLDQWEDFLFAVRRDLGHRDAKHASRVTSPTFHQGPSVDRDRLESGPRVIVGLVAAC